MVTLIGISLLVATIASLTVYMDRTSGFVMVAENTTTSKTSGEGKLYFARTKLATRTSA